MPEPQNNLQRAIHLAFDAIDSQRAEQMAWLGATYGEGTWRVPLLDDSVGVDLTDRRIIPSAGRELSLAGSVLVLHYLAIASRPEKRAPEIVFADLPTARSYARVYHQRVIGRLCATTGRDAEKLHAAAVAAGGRSAAGGDAAFDFQVFPRFLVRLVWHSPDEEFPSSATLFLPAQCRVLFLFGGLGGAVGAVGIASGRPAILTGAKHLFCGFEPTLKRCNLRGVVLC